MIDPVDLVFLALCLWRECRGETFSAKVAVANVIMNRVKKGGWWGTDVLSVTTKPWQFSGMTATGDPNLVKFPKKGSSEWEECLQIAKDMLSGNLSDSVRGATYYHDTSIELPEAWGQMELVAQIGRLKFYKPV